MNTKDIETVSVKVKAAQVAISAERDKLRDLIEDSESIIESCDRALDALETAADALSEYL